MYEVEIKSRDSQVGIGNGYVIPEHQISNLIGKLLTLVETLGLQEKQENSFKDIIKQAVWSNVRDNKPVDSELLTLVNNFIHEKDREENNRHSDRDSLNCYSPKDNIQGEYTLTFKEVKQEK